MGLSSHRWPTLAAVVVIAILAAACSGGSGNDASAIDDTGSRIAQMAGVDTEDRCDLGFNTARFNETTELVHHVHDEHPTMGDVDFTVDEWAEVFVDEELGMTVDEVVDELEANDVYRRHVLGGVLTHTLDPVSWTPMTDDHECEALAGELREARAAAARYPTVADALADGYTLGDWYNAGLGVHYQNFGYIDVFEPAQPAQLLFDGTDDDSILVGLSYVVSAPGDVPPDGFTGDNDRWHRHGTWCLDVDRGGVNLGTDVLSEDECAGLGGSITPNPGLWMLHTWVVPGCESDWGTFSGANPRLPYLPDGVAFASGCNSGATLADPLDLDGRGRGPEIS